MNQYIQRPDNGGYYKDSVAADGVEEAMPYDFSSAEYSYPRATRPNNKANSTHQAPTHHLSYSPLKNVGSSVLNADHRPRGEIQREKDVTALRAMNSNLKAVHFGEEQNVDQIDAHIQKVKSQPYFGQLYPTDLDQTVPGQDSGLMSLRMQNRSQFEVRQKSSLKEGYRTNESKARNTDENDKYSHYGLDDKYNSHHEGSNYLYENVPTRR